MKLLSKNTGYFLNIEHYDLHDIFSEKEDCKGLVICYALAMFKDFRYTLLDLKAAQEEIGVAVAWHNKYSGKSFHSLFGSLKQFLDAYNSEDFGCWTLNVLYQNVELVISGKKDETQIGVSYPKEMKLELSSLFNEIERASLNLVGQEKNDG